MRIDDIIRARDPDGFPARLAQKILGLPGLHKVGVEMAHITSAELAEVLGQDNANRLGLAGMTLAYIAARQETLDLLFPELNGQNSGFSSL